MSQDFVGYYWTPKLELNFFRTKIALYNDSTFYWNYCGDLVFEELSGRYHKHKNIIILDIKPKYDSVKSPNAELYAHGIDTTFLPSSPIIYDKNENITRRYLIRRNCLIPISKNGKRQRRAKLVKVDKEKWKHRVGVWIEYPDTTKNK